MRFGIFAAPFHPHDQNPTLHYQSDLELIVRLDELGYDEAWIGEHHSGGWEMVGSPELLCAVAADSIVVFQRKPDWIHLRMTVCAAGVLAMELHAFAQGVST